MEDTFVFNLDPTIWHIGGPFQLRYYGIIFATMLGIGFVIWRRQMVRGGHSLELAERFLIYGVVAVLAGSRLGHCLFYHPETYLRDPITILYFWKGGLSSHGATAGLIIAMFIFARRYKLHFFEVLDRCSMSSCVGAAAVRLGNFFNSEIVGRQTDVPWAVRFPIYDCHGHREVCSAAVPRHPSQLYEFALGMFVLLVLVLVDRWTGKEKRPRGLLASLFLLLYFTGRFFVEFVKEYQALERSSALTMGQYLSILPFLCGVALLVWTIRNRHREWPAPEPVLAGASKSSAKSTKKKTKSKKRKR